MPLAAAFVGAAISMLDTGDVQGDRSVTIFGDQLAFLGAVFVVGYIVCGRILRDWMPLFLYAFPVTLIGGFLLIPASWLLESYYAEFGASDTSDIRHWFGLYFLPSLLGCWDIQVSITA